MQKKSTGNRTLAEFGISSGQVVKLVEEEHCYKVANADDFERTNRERMLVHSMGKARGSREDFERQVTRDYGTTNLEWICKKCGKKRPVKTQDGFCRDCGGVLTKEKVNER